MGNITRNPDPFQKERQQILENIELVGDHNPGPAMIRMLSEFAQKLINESQVQFGNLEKLQEIFSKMSGNQFLLFTLKYKLDTGYMDYSEFLQEEKIIQLLSNQLKRIMTAFDNNQMTITEYRSIFNDLSSMYDKCFEQSNKYFGDLEKTFQSMQADSTYELKVHNELITNEKYQDALLKFTEYTRNLVKLAPVGEELISGMIGSMEEMGSLEADFNPENQEDELDVQFSDEMFRYLRNFISRKDNIINAMRTTTELQNKALEEAYKEIDQIFPSMKEEILKQHRANETNSERKRREMAEKLDEPLKNGESSLERIFPELAGLRRDRSEIESTISISELRENEPIQEQHILRLIIYIQKIMQGAQTQFGLLDKSQEIFSQMTGKQFFLFTMSYKSKTGYMDFAEFIAENDISQSFAINLYKLMMKLGNGNMSTDEYNSIFNDVNSSYEKYMKEIETYFNNLHETFTNMQKNPTYEEEMHSKLKTDLEKYQNNLVKFFTYTKSTVILSSSIADEAINKGVKNFQDMDIYDSEVELSDSDEVEDREFKKLGSELLKVQKEFLNKIDNFKHVIKTFLELQKSALNEAGAEMRQIPMSKRIEMLLRQKSNETKAEGLRRDLVEQIKKPLEEGESKLERSIQYIAEKKYSQQVKMKDDCSIM